MATMVLLVTGLSPDSDTTTAKQVGLVRDALEEKGANVRWINRAKEALAIVGADSTLDAVIADWGMEECEDMLRAVAGRFPNLPVFLIATEHDHLDLPLWVYEKIQGFVSPLEDTPSFIAGRIIQAASTYADELLPPFFRALSSYVDEHSYSWHTPAHAGGVAFLKSAAGRAFFDFYGERLLRTDLSISVAALGSPLEHTGPIGDAERNAARVFGAERTHFVMNGNSTANRIVGHHAIARDEIALVDRNCHKSVQHALAISGARPVYLVPQRNGLGLAGPIPAAAMSKAGVAGRLMDHPFAADAGSLDPSYAVVTNSTYDGLCYDAVQTAQLLAESAPRVHFDEAWFAYARFNPLYRNRYGMAVDERTLPGPDRPTVFATQSTHKLLAALSQSAMLHLRSAPRAPVDPDRLNETYLMHASTSPLYPMIASLDVATAMMDGPSGEHLTREAITEAVRFRQHIVRIADQISAQKDRPDWFFSVFQPPTITQPSTGVSVPFQDADLELLCSDPSCWTLAPEAPWHGFDSVDEGRYMLDPIKVTIVCPGGDAATGTAESGIPARIVAAYLARRGIVVEKSGDHTLLVLFSLGITKGKWGTLIDALMDFKHAYDAEASLDQVLPGMGSDRQTLRALCDQVHATLRDSKLSELLDEVFTELPTPVLTPSECYQELIRDRIERIPLGEFAHRIAATTVVVTPPGIPIVMPGERAGPPDGPLLRYLQALERFDRKHPEFATDIHGTHRDADGRYWIDCVTSKY